MTAALPPPHATSKPAEHTALAGGRQTTKCPGDLSKCAAGPQDVEPPPACGSAAAGQRGWRRG